MLCRHGLDNIACPICRIGSIVTPPINLEVEDSQLKLLEHTNPVIKEIRDKRIKMLNLLSDKKPNLRVNPHLILPEPPSIGKISLIEPPIYKRLKELDAEIPEEFNPQQEVSINLPDGKIKKNRKL